jgi:hypothetical protein
VAAGAASQKARGAPPPPQQDEGQVEHLGPDWSSAGREAGYGGSVAAGMRRDVAVETSGVADEVRRVDHGGWLAVLGNAQREEACVNRCIARIEAESREG